MIKPTNVRWAEYEAYVWERERCIGLMEKPAGKSQFGTTKHRQKDKDERSERNRLDGQQLE
jgi:hypothetical protein